MNKYVIGTAAGMGHLYMVNGHKEMSNVILNGECKGKTLWEVFAMQKDVWDMSGYEEFPLTIALVDAAENLSIQVHPNDTAAEQIEKKRLGKTESWVFLDAPADEWIYAGCRCKTKEEVEVAIGNGEMERITDHLKIAKGDYVCIEAGTLHAMTSGSLVYEIEYGSDYTYRFYDYRRRDKDGNTRELHIDKAIKAMNPQTVPTIRRIEDDIWISEKNYEICRKSGINRYKNNSRVVECVSIIEGSGNCDGCQVVGGMSVILLPGEELSNVIMNTAIVARIRKINAEEN